MRTRRATIVAAGIAALAVGVPAANAATATLTLNPATGIRALGESNGVRGYQFNGTVYSQEFLVAVTDDAGQPVTSCLGDGGAVRLVNAKTGEELDTSSCALSGDGLFHLFPKNRIVFPVGVVAQVTASVPFNGNPVSAAQSNGAVIVISPSIRDTSPSVVSGRLFPIRGKVETPRPNKAGVVRLEYRVGAKWKVQRTRPLPVSGNYEFKVSQVGRYRVHFVAKKGSGYVDSYMTMRIRRV